MSERFDCELPQHGSSPAEIRDALEKYRVVAVVGLSTDPSKPSYEVAAYLQGAGYKIVPIHPRAVTILGEKAYPGLLAVPRELGIEIVDIFRRPDAVMPHVEEAIAIGAKLVWFQEGIVNNAAAARALAAGLGVVQSRCMLKEHRRL
jgi:hypothetical protein